MTEQLELVPAAPSPWPELRAQYPEAILVRVICTTPLEQLFVRIARTPENTEKGAPLYDGATVYTSAPTDGRGYTEAAQAAIEADADRQFYAEASA